MNVVLLNYRETLEALLVEQNRHVRAYAFRSSSIIKSES